MRAESCLAVDVGGSYVRAGYADQPRPARVAVSPGDTAALLEEIAAAIRSASGSIAGRSPTAVAIACPGLVKGGRIEQALYLPLTGVDLKGALEDAVDLPVFVANDVSAQALGDPGADSGASFFAIGVGTAVGGALVHDGTPQGRPGGTVGEIGHLPVSLDETGCACGGYGCLDLYLAGHALERALGPRWWTREMDAKQEEALQLAGKATAQAIRALEVSLELDYVLLLGRVFSQRSLWEGLRAYRGGLGSEVPVALARDTWPHCARGLVRLASASESA